MSWNAVKHPVQGGHIPGALNVVSLDGTDGQWLQLKSLGYPDVRVLDGGWGIWDWAFTLPVVTGENPYDEEFAL